MKRYTLAIMLAVSMLSACSDKERHEADNLMIQINSDFEAGRYEEVIRNIDSLRANHPKCIEARRDALKLYKEASLKLAQKDLAKTDSLLEIAKEEFTQLNDRMVQGLMNEGESNTLTEARMKRDSLQIRYETLGAKIRYIHKRQGEDK